MPILLRCRCSFDEPSKSSQASLCDEQGLAVLIVLIALSLFSLLGFYMNFNGVTEVRISDNYESHIQARYAAQAGIAHARELLRGLDFDDVLKGPDGTYTNTSAYLSQAKTYGFRTLISWATARSLDATDPTSAVSSLPDDGILNSGKVGATNGTPLIPVTGIGITAPNPYGSGTITTARYFVKVSDNNGEPSELAKDPADNPFFDGDRIIVVRSLGVSRTIREETGSVIRANSVVVMEARYKRRGTFDLDAPFVVQGNDVVPSSSSMFNGNSFDMVGGTNNRGIATIDVNNGDATYPSTQITSQLQPNQFDNVQGMGMTPSVGDITGSVSADPDKALLLDTSFLWNFVTQVLPRFADNIYTGNQSWSGGSAPDLGSYDYTKPYNDPTQNPKMILVDGDLSLSGNMSGGGVLVVRGKLTLNGSLNYNGIILVIGSGDLEAGGTNVEVQGGIYVVNVINSGGVLSFGTPKLSISGNSDFIINSETIKMGLRLFPPAQIGFREILSSMDP